MKKRKLISIVLSLAFSLSVSTFTVNAETVEQDGISVSYSTDKSQYTASDKINATLTVKNNNEGPVYDVELDEAVPDGFALEDGSLKYKSIDELKSGESQELKTVFVKSVDDNTSSSDSSVTDPNSNDNSSSSQLPAADSNNSTPGKTDANPNTGDTVIVLIYIVFALAACFIITSFKRGKGKHLLSLLLVVSVLGTIIPGAEFNVKAVGNDIKVTAAVKVDGEDVELTATVKYNTLSQVPDDEPSAAEEYYKENAEIIDVVDVSPGETLSEAEVTKLLNEKGFTDYPITYNYSLSGDFDNEQESDPASEVKHPMYGTYYISKNNEIWYITVVGKDIYANPLSYNIQTERKVPTMLSTASSIISYDDEKDRLYTVIPKESAMIVVKVDDINSALLDDLTVEEVDKL